MCADRIGTTTVRVRIAVAVAPDGSWNASGYGIALRSHRSPVRDDELADMMMQADDTWNEATQECWPEGSTNLYWVETDLLIPEPKAPPVVYAQAELVTEASTGARAQFPATT